MEEKDGQQPHDIGSTNTSEMPPLKIGIVEDEVVIAESLEATLSHLGYDVLEPANDYIEAISMLTKHKPDLVILDIMLNDDRDGIDLAERINKEFHIPFIFLTANADKATVGRAKKTQPSSYLIKPFTRTSLYSSIEVAMDSIQSRRLDAGPTSSVFVKDGSVMKKLVLHQVWHIEAERVYLNVHTTDRQHTLRMSISEMLETLNDKRFMQIHRSHVVNIDHIDEIGLDYVSIRGTQIPVSKSNRKRLREIVLKG